MSDANKDSLVEISVESLPNLRDKFKADWPDHVVAFSLIDNFYKRFCKFPESQTLQKVYSLNGDWENDGTFVATMVREFLWPNKHKYSQSDIF